MKVSNTEMNLHSVGETSLQTTRGLVLCAMCTAVTCVIAPFSIPLPGGVPLSLATFAAMLAGALLGGQGGAASQIIYILLGAVGLPVFSGWTGGAGRIFGMTGGYIIGYIPLAWFTGMIYKIKSSCTRMSARVSFLILGMLAGNAALYFLGTLWFMNVTGMNLSGALAACVIPFIPGDLIKMAAVVVIAPPVEAAIRRAAPVYR